MLFFFSSFVAFSVISNMFHIINIIKIQNDEFKFDKLVKYYRVNYYLDPWFSERISARLEYATRSSTRRKITTRFTRWHISPRRAKANRSSSLPRKFHFQICNRVSSSLRHPSYLLQFHSTVLKPTTKRYKKLQVESRQNSRRPKILPSKISLLQDTYIYIYIHTYTPVGANRCPETRTAPLDFLSRMVERRHPMMGARRKRCVPWYRCSYLIAREGCDSSWNCSSSKRNNVTGI